MEQRPLDVAIAGGGLGGLCLAHGLRGAGVNATVYERDRDRHERLQGYRIHINGDGATALRACLPEGHWDLIVATEGSASDSYRMNDERLRTIAAFGPRPGALAEEHHSLSRITLRQILLHGLGDAVEFDREFQRYECAEGGRITLRFADGGTAGADVLVAADGGGSRIRRQYLPHAERRDTGIVAVAGKYPLTSESRAQIPESLWRSAQSVLPKGREGMFLAPHELSGTPLDLPVGIGGNDPAYGLDPDALFDNTGSYVLWAYAARPQRLPTGTAPAELDGAGLRSLVAAQIRDWHPGLRTLVDNSPEDGISLLAIRSATPVGPWAPSTVTLLGDAIHSMTPMAGIGANIALRDAALLAHRLIAVHRGERGAVEAIGSYESEMRDYGFAAVRSAMDNATMFVGDQPLKRGLAKAGMRAVNAIGPLRRRMFGEPRPVGAADATTPARPV